MQKSERLLSLRVPYHIVQVFSKIVLSVQPDFRIVFQCMECIAVFVQSPVKEVVLIGHLYIVQRVDYVILCKMEVFIKLIKGCYKRLAAC